MELQEVDIIHDDLWITAFVHEDEAVVTFNPDTPADALGSVFADLIKRGFIHSADQYYDADLEREVVVLVGVHD